MKRKKIHTYFVVIAVFLNFTSCQWPYELFITNLHDSNIKIRFGVYEAPNIDGMTDTTIFRINKGETKSIETLTYFFSAINWDQELRLIEVTDENGNVFYNRFTAELLRSLEFKFTLPFIENKSKPSLEIINRQLQNYKLNKKLYPKYISIEYSYNKNQYTVCIQEIDSLNVQSEFAKLNSEEIEYRMDKHHLRGIVFIGMLSAIKTNQINLSKEYYKILVKHYPEFAKHIIKNDPEIINLIKKYSMDFV